jgi:polar amino acid transport system substrate-binding protein
LPKSKKESEKELRRRDRTIGPAGWTLLAITVLVVAFLYHRATSTRQTADTLKRIELTGIVRIGYANEAPYGYLDSASGRITGEAPEIAKVILTRMGATEIIPSVAEFGSLIPGLKADRFDVIAAGMYITPERAEEISFSNPTYAIGEALLVASGNPLELHSFEDVAASGNARIAVMGGSVEHGYAKKLGVPTERIVIFPDYASAVEGLATGRVDAVAATDLTANDLLRKSGDVEIERAAPFADPVIDGKSVQGFGAFGFRQSDDAFRQEFNRRLAEFIGTKEHLELVREFGFSKETLPGDATAEEIIRGP